MTDLDKTQLTNIILDNIEDGIFIIDKSRKILLFNKAASTITEFENREVLGKDCLPILKFINKHGIHVSHESHPLKLAWMNQKVIRQHDAYILSKNNKKIPIHLIVSPIYDKSKKIKKPEDIDYVVGVMREMSFEKQQEEAKTDFVSTASHEMRTPIAGLEGYLSLLSEQSMDKEAQSYVQHAHQLSLYLGQLFKDLLTTSQSEDGQLHHEPIILNLINLLKEITTKHQAKAQAKQINLEIVQTDVKSDLIKADPKRLEELFNNLYENAIKYTKNNGQIKISITTVDEFFQIKIEDNGLGMSKTDLKHIFQKFYRIDNSQPGTGLGLFICRKIVELYNGDIWVESQLGQGTQFYISLPRYTESETDFISS